MKYFRITLIGLALAVSIGLGAANAIDTNRAQPGPAFCQRCGDGYCAKSCENATTCPQDCGPGGGTTK